VRVPILKRPTGDAAGISLNRFEPGFDVPIVVVSGVDGAHRDTKRLNAVEFVPKPIDDDALLRVIRSHFELRRAANGHR
jgi:FixJ family two-component response regulator